MFLLLILMSVSISVAETLPNKESITPADGILRLNNQFSIFPDNKLGNSVYLNKKRLVSRDDLTMVDIVQAPEGYIYHGLDENGSSILGFAGNENAKFIQLPGGFYHLVTDENNKKKIYWINGKRKIEDLLPRRNSGSGLVFNGSDKAVFYHIAKGESVETEEGKERYQYTFRIHIANTETRSVRHLPVSIKDFSLRLRLEWADENTIKYTLSNGQVETVSIQ